MERGGKFHAVRPSIEPRSEVYHEAGALLNLAEEKSVKKVGAGYPCPFVLVPIRKSIRDGESALASQPLGVRVAEQGIRPLRFARSKMGHPAGSIGNVTNSGIHPQHKSELTDTPSIVRSQ